MRNVKVTYILLIVSFNFTLLHANEFYKLNQTKIINVRCVNFFSLNNLAENERISQPKFKVKIQNYNELSDTSLNVNSLKKSYFIIGIKGGLNISSSKSYANVYSQSTLPSKSRRSLLVGVSIAYNLKKFFSYGLDINYNSLGFMHKTAATDINGSLTYYYYQEWSFNYIYTPLTIGFRSNNDFYIYSKLGAGPSFLMKQQFKGDNVVFKIDDRNASKMPFTYSIEIGFGYRFKDNFSINLSGSYLRLNDKLGCNASSFNFGINKYL